MGTNDRYDRIAMLDQVIARVNMESHHPAYQTFMQKAYLLTTAPNCLCRAPELITMYIARMGDTYIVKRCPKTGHLHRPECESHGGISTAAQAFYSDDALAERADGKVTHNLAVPLSTIQQVTGITLGEAAAPQLPDVQRAKRSTMIPRGFLNLFWKEAGLHSWSPSVAGNGPPHRGSSDAQPCAKFQESVMNCEKALLQLTRPIDMRQFDDAQFLREPRLRMMQQAFHSMRQTTYTWAQQGILGEAQKQESDQQVRPADIAVFASATMQRPTLNQYQADRINHARHLIDLLLQCAKTVGHPCECGEEPGSEHQFCDLGGTTLGARGHIDSRGAWVYFMFEPLQDANHPINRITMLQTPRRKLGIPATLRLLPLREEQARERVLEMMELARWLLRQPAYSPAA